MIIKSVKKQGKGWLVNGTKSVPDDENNKDCQEVLAYIAEGGDVDAEFTLEELIAKESNEHRALLNSELQKLKHDFGDGRIIQTRPQDQQNIQGKIAVIQMGGSDLFVMDDNKPYPVTAAELQTALEVGIAAAGDLWDQYMETL